MNNQQINPKYGNLGKRVSPFKGLGDDPDFVPKADEPKVEPKKRISKRMLKIAGSAAVGIGALGFLAYRSASGSGGPSPQASLPTRKLSVQFEYKF